MTPLTAPPRNPASLADVLRVSAPALDPRDGTVTGMRRAIVYCRISEDREESFGGVENQEDMCLRLAEDLGWQVVCVYVDNDLSATSGKPREWYEHMLRDLKAGRADAILAAHPDRIYRNPIDLEELIRIVDSKDVLIRTRHAGEIDLATGSGRMVARVVGAAARAEVDRMIERQRDHKDKMAAKGQWRGGPRPFGYNADGMTLNEPEAMLLKEIIVRFLEGDSLNTLVRYMNGPEGMPTSFGKKWTSNNLKQVIRRARNAGIVEQTRTNLIFPAQWPAISGVDENTWRRINAILDSPERRTNEKGGVPLYIGGGIYKCGKCGATLKSGTTMVGRYREGESRAGALKYRNYVCSAEKHLSRQAAAVDSYVLEAIREGMRDGYALKVLTAAAGHNAQEVIDRIKELDDELLQLAQMETAGELDFRQVAEMSRPRRQEKAQLNGQLTAVASASPLIGIADDTEPVRAFNAAPLDRQRRILRAMYDVTLLPAWAGYRNDDPENPYPRFDEQTVVLTRCVS